MVVAHVRYHAANHPQSDLYPDHDAPDVPLWSYHPVSLQVDHHQMVHHRVSHVNELTRLRRWGMVVLLHHRRHGDRVMTLVE